MQRSLEYVTTGLRAGPRRGAAAVMAPWGAQRQCRCQCMPAPLGSVGRARAWDHRTWYRTAAMQSRAPLVLPARRHTHTHTQQCTAAVSGAGPGVRVRVRLPHSIKTLMHKHTKFSTQVLRYKLQSTGMILKQEMRLQDSKCNVRSSCARRRAAATGTTCSVSARACPSAL